MRHPGRERAHPVWLSEDRREDGECRKGMKVAQDEVERMKERLTLLEQSRPPRDAPLLDACEEN